MKRLSDTKIAFTIVMKYRQQYPTVKKRLTNVMQDINMATMFKQDEEESKIDEALEDDFEETDDSMDEQ